MYVHIQLFGSELVAGLHYLHSNSILFCDLKPANILIDEFGSLKVRVVSWCSDKVQCSPTLIVLCAIARRLWACPPHPIERNEHKRTGMYLLSYLLMTRHHS